MNNLLKFKDYDPSEEYKSGSRRSLNLDIVRKSKEYKRIIKLGFDEEHHINKRLTTL